MIGRRPDGGRPGCAPRRFAAAISRSVRPVVTVLLVCAASPAFAAERVQVVVTPDQRVSVTGRSASLRTLLEDVCWRAGVTLRAFDAEDRDVQTGFAELPFARALERLLTRESFLIGMSAPESGATRVTWVHVLGPTDRARARRRGASPGRTRRAFEIPPDLLRAAFSAENPRDQEAALRQIASRILDDPRERAAFLATDAALIVETLSRYPRAKILIGQLHSEQKPGPVKEKLEDIIRAM